MGAGPQNIWSHSSHGTKLGQRASFGGPSLLASSLPQEQGLKANNSKELSMCFTEVSEGQSEGWVQGPEGGVFQVSLGLGAPRSHCTGQAS